MIPDVKNAYLDGRLMLLLGAGASYGCKDSKGLDLPIANGLAQELTKNVGWEYENEPLSVVYSAINAKDAAKLHSLIRQRFTNTRPSKALLKIASYPWPRVYTLNIDDCFEAAIRINRQQSLSVMSRNDSLEELDPLFKNVQLIKLNGSADRPQDGFIFSPQEYGDGSNRLPTWYKELGQNYSSYTFLFIGSSLNEPLFQHALAEMRSTTHRHPQRGYVITPKASAIEKEHLKSLNLEHIAGTVEDFSEWMAKEVQSSITGWDLAISRRPELRNLTSLSDKQKHAFNSITLVSDSFLPKTVFEAGVIRDFYKGYKPLWSDILNGVPAELNFMKEFSDFIKSSSVKKSCIALVGQAGSGKTTTMMTAALRLSNESQHPVYFLRETTSDIKDIIFSLEEINQELFYLFIDKVELMEAQISEALSSNLTKNICIVFSERMNIWNRRVKNTLQPITKKVFSTKKINEEDSKKILEKLERYGPWTYLEKLSKSERLKEIYDKSDRQLLIGLMEATTGLGFTEIIQKDFKNVGSDSHKKFLVLIGLASIHRSTISSNIIGRALNRLEISEDVNTLASEVEGIVSIHGDKYAARHAVYVRELFVKILKPDLIKECIIGLLGAFSDYKTPVKLHVGKADGVVFKSICNHRFIKEMMRNDETKVRDIYQKFETVFYADGLYWLQYGLALRGFGKHAEALEKLKTARQAYTSPQIEHAYAQQLMIVANEASTLEDAELVINEAIQIFESLPVDKPGWQGDTYPIVSLAEGHISFVHRFKGLDAAKVIARQYGNKLLAAHKNHPNERLQAAATNVVTFVTSGIWNENTALETIEE